MNSTAELSMFLVVIFVALPAYVLFYQFGLRYVITYRLTNRSILIMLFWVVPIFRISYPRIQEIKVGADWPESLRDIIVWNFCNRLYGRSGCVVIHRKQGLTAAISPDDPEGFVQELRRRAHQGTGEWPLVT
jgi:hypothetical protein